VSGLQLRKQAMARRKNDAPSTTPPSPPAKQKEPSAPPEPTMLDFRRTVVPNDSGGFQMVATEEELPTSGQRTYLAPPPEGFNPDLTEAGMPRLRFEEAMAEDERSPDRRRFGLMFIQVTADGTVQGVGLRPPKAVKNTD